MSTQPTMSHDTADTDDEPQVCSPTEKTEIKSRSPLFSKDDDDDDDDDEQQPELVALLGLGLTLFGMLGFYFIPGMISDEANGNRLVNSFYCSIITLTTIGFGDICPADPGPFGRAFLFVLAMGGLGTFCGPILNLASSWKDKVPGGLMAVGSVTLAIGVFIFTWIEGMSYSEAVHLSVITGTTIGYGNAVPTSDLGRLAVAVYAVLVCNVVAALLEPGREYLETLCRKRRQRVPAAAADSNKLTSAQISSLLSASENSKME